MSSLRTFRDMYRDSGCSYQRWPVPRTVAAGDVGLHGNNEASQRTRSTYNGEESSAVVLNCLAQTGLDVGCQPVDQTRLMIQP
jgi:hypothetical protein